MDIWFSCAQPGSVVKNKPPRKAVAENLGTFMPICCFSLIFISFYIYIYAGYLSELVVCDEYNKICRERGYQVSSL